MKSEPKFE